MSQCFGSRHVVNWSDNCTSGVPMEGLLCCCGAMRVAYGVTYANGHTEWSLVPVRRSPEQLAAMVQMVREAWT